MCGIAGIYFFRANRQPESISKTVTQLTKSIGHRGPDDFGYAFFDQAGLGMRRLSIIDVKSGKQPIWDEDKKRAIVFNGEIYNYKSLKKQLEAKGVKFNTSSDTEVVFKGFLLYGPQFVEKLEGMFAYAVYDDVKKELFLARDRLGKKPLYLYRDDEKLVFCSETQAFFKAKNLPLKLSKQAYWDFLTYRYVPGEQSIVENVIKLGPGKMAFVKAEGITVKRYWDIPKTDFASLGQKSTIDDKFGKLFQESVRKRLIADEGVGVGVVLSGGIDSCAVLYEASKVRPISSYHVFFDVGENYNELKYAQMMAEATNSDLQTVKVSEKEFIDQLSNAANFCDEPLSDLSTIPFKYVCDLAVKDVKVVLSGEGSDEILAGYGLHHFYKMYLLFKMAKIHPLISRLAKSIGSFFFPQKKWSYLDIPIESLAKDLHYNITYQLDQKQKLEMLKEDGESYKNSVRFLDKIYNHYQDQDVINQILHVIGRDWLIEDVLMKSDKVSMSSSLEVRCPFLDHSLVDFLYSLSGKRKIGFFKGNLETKVILRRYLDGKIPREILTRKKLGFPVPAYALVSKTYRDYVFDKLSSEHCFYHNFFCKNKLMQIFDKVVKNNSFEETKMKHFLWTIVNFENWYENKKLALQG